MPEKYSLREKKSAKTKIALMREFIKRLEHTRFEDISIRQVCASVEVSEGTFFNYFPKKIEIVYFCMQLHAVKVVWTAYDKVKTNKSYDLICRAFQVLFEEFNNPYLVYEMISSLIKEKEDPHEFKISNAEKYYAYPELKGIEEIISPGDCLDLFFKECLQKAIINKELPKSIDINNVCVALKTIMVGTPMAVKFKNFHTSSEQMARQLKTLWIGLGGNLK
ncbi:MAG: TetR/AcrR family transcriptional regulator [Candidatus Omnitrophica bacterium]|nr:TetR/AcrR family transcriptional regulator [Candidatus Omnitrophota bacterium]